MAQTVRSALNQEHVYEINTSTSDALPTDVLTQANLNTAGAHNILKVRAIVTGADAYVYPSAGRSKLNADPAVGASAITVTDSTIFTEGRAVAIVESGLTTEFHNITDIDSATHILTLDGTTSADFTVAAYAVDVPNENARLNVTEDYDLIREDGVNWKGLVIQRQAATDVTIVGWAVIV